VTAGSAVTDALLAALNPAQREAVEAPDGPLLIFAGAGSGKTRVLTHRIAYVIAARGVRPQEVLAVTFTNKAAREMRSRVERLLGADVSGMWLGTFHSVGARILRRDGDAIGIPSNFVIYDETDRLAAMRRAMQSIGVDDKRIVASKVVHTVSAAKNELLDAAAFASRASGYWEGEAARIYRAYEAAMTAAGALDFDDLLMRTVQLLRDVPAVLERYRNRWRHLFVDEYQDTNHAQYLMVSLLAATHRNLTVVGDDDQCLAAGTLVSMADGSRKPIEEVREGDMVCSAGGSGTVRSARVLRVSEREAVEMVRIRTAAGRELVSTPEHVHFAGYRLGVSPNYHFVYLMHKVGFGYRIGTSQVHTAGRAKAVVGFRQRAVQEHADALWILAVHSSENDAREDEYITSLRYQIPTLPFVPRKGSKNGLVHDPDRLKAVFAAFDTETAGLRLLDDRGLSPEHPHHHPRSRNSSRRNIVVTLCADRRGATPMHLIAVGGNDQRGAETIRGLGLRIRPAHSDSSSSWRYETVFKDMATLMETATQLRDALDGVIVTKARFGVNGHADREANSLPATRADSVRPGMAMFDESCGYDIVAGVERITGRQCVCDIDVEHTHNFIANGLITHNSVYRFRGADIRNILEFQKDFPDARVVTLEQNYRSSQPILDTAHAVIRVNQDRAAKRLWTERGGGEPVRLIPVYDEREEALAVCGEIEKLTGTGAHSLSDVAVLYRTNAQSRAFEDVLLRRGIPYRLVGGLRFYERKEVKDVLAYLRLVANPRDPVAFGRIVNVPRRKIGERSVAELERIARRRRISPFEAVQDLGEEAELGPAALQALAGFAALVARLGELSGRLPVPRLIERIVEETGYQAMLRDGTPEGEERWTNVTELVGYSEEYADVPPPDGLHQFLENVALVADVDSLDDSTSGVTLITLHQVKGLEFPVVFLAGLEEGLLPHVRALEEGDEGIAEERRLVYVGVTRAQDRLYLLHAFRRHLYGSAQLAQASRFLADIPAEMLRVVRPPGGPPVTAPRQPGAVREAVHAHAVRANPVEVAPQRYAEGMRVDHPKYGTGTILKSTMTRAGEEVVIRFDEAGMKIFAVAEARLSPAEG
jgi:DNA helicase-2/ATP-dependent DNA helicase PcrA